MLLFSGDRDNVIAFYILRLYVKPLSVITEQTLSFKN